MLKLFLKSIMLRDKEAYMRSRIVTIYQTIVKFRKEQYGDTKTGVSHFFMLLISLFGALCISENMRNIHRAVCVIVAGAGIYGILFAGKRLIPFVEKGIFKYGIWNMLCIIFLGMCIYYGMKEGYTPSKLIWLPMVGVLLIECIFARCLYALFLNKKKNIFVIVPLAVTFVINIYIGVFCIQEGYPATYVEEYRALNSFLETGVKEVSYKPRYEVKTFTYGVGEGKEVQTKTVDMSVFLESYKGITEKLRAYYWGYGKEQIPLEGKVWYPDGEGRFPLLFLIHGNADMGKQSYLGYGYLGEYLARTGYIVVSVNEAWCNYFMGKGFSDENDARAILLLENMKEVLSWKEQKENPLYQSMQTDAISIAGHSRGGEAVAIAAEFNQLSHYPDNGAILLDYHFPIETVIAIAPTSDQYQPSGRTVVLKDVNYFLIHGANDQDVSTCMGMKQYEHIKFSKNADKRKAYVYIAGANHGQFNTEWGRYDGEFPEKLIYNAKPIMAPEEQRSLLKQYIKVCLDVTIKKETANQDFLWNIEAYDASLPKTVFIQGYQDASYEPIAEYEEDADLTTGKEPGFLIKADKVMMWKEIKASEYQDFDTGNHSVYLEWKGTREAAYELTVSDLNLQGKSLLFDVMNVMAQDTAEGFAKKMDFTIQVMDASGNTSNVTVSNYKTIYPPFQVVYSKIVKLYNMLTYKRQFQSVRIDADEFAKTNLELDLGHITRISFQFNRRGTGQILLDNIGILSNVL